MAKVMKQKFDTDAWTERQATQLRQRFTVPYILVDERTSLVEAIAQASIYGTEIVFTEGIHTLQTPLTIARDDIWIRGCGWGTTLKCVNGAFLTFSGARCHLSRLHIEGPGATDPRASTYLLVASGTEFESNRVWYSDNPSGIYLSGTYANAIGNKLDDWAGYGIFQDGDYGLLSGNMITPGTGNCIRSTGDKSIVTENRMVGGTWAITGAGSAWSDNIG